MEYTNISKSSLNFQSGLNSIRAAVVAKFANPSQNQPNNELLPGGGLEGSTMEDDEILDKSTTKDTNTIDTKENSETNTNSNTNNETKNNSNNNIVPANSFTSHNQMSAAASAANSKNDRQMVEISEYVSEESQMFFYANLHFALGNIRNSLNNSSQQQYHNTQHSSSSASSSLNSKAPKIESAPRVLIIGPKDSGKTSLSKVLVAYDVKRGSTPVFVNLDPTESVFSAPGSLSVSVVSDILDVEQGWGSSPFTGPAIMHPNQPHVRFFGLQEPLKNVAYYNQLVGLLAETAEKRVQKSQESLKSAGMYIDTPASLVAPDNQQVGLQVVQNIVNKFKINVLLVVGNERLYSTVKKMFAKNGTGSNAGAKANTQDNSVQHQQVTVVSVPKSGGVVDRDVDYMSSVQMQLVNEYFYGTSKQPLSPFTVTIDYSTLTVYKVSTPTSSAAATSAVVTATPISINDEKMTENGTNSSLDSSSTQSQDLSDKNGENGNENLNQNSEDNSTPKISISNDGDEEMVDANNTSANTTDTASNSFSSSATTASFQQQSQLPSPSATTLTKIDPSAYLQNALLAVVDASPEDSVSKIESASVLFYVHVAEADDTKKKMRVLMPTHGRLPNKVLVVGEVRYYE